jgi:hypothetical protein
MLDEVHVEEWFPCPSPQLSPEQERPEGALKTAMTPGKLCEFARCEQFAEVAALRL